MSLKGDMYVVSLCQRRDSPDKTHCIPETVCKFEITKN